MKLMTTMFLTGVMITFADFDDRHPPFVPFVSRAHVLRCQHLFFLDEHVLQEHPLVAEA